MALDKFDNYFVKFVVGAICVLGVLFVSAVLYRNLHKPDLGFSVVSTIKEVEGITPPNSGSVFVHNTSNPQVVLKSLAVEGLKNIAFEYCSFAEVADWSSVDGIRLNNIEVRQCKDFDIQTVEKLCSFLKPSGILQFNFDKEDRIGFLSAETQRRLKKEYKIDIVVNHY